MGMGALRYSQSGSQAATYWRRRFLALVGGLAILAVLAWACSGAFGSSLAARTSAAGGALAGGRAARQGGHGAGGSGAVPARSAQPSALASPAPAASPAAAASSPAAALPQPAGSQDPAAGQPGRCHSSDVVLSLSASQNSFSAREIPVFDVAIVSTSAGRCTFNVGAKHVMLVIRAGRVRIWGSADCVEGRGSLITSLERGVPTTLPISWDRQTSSPGCRVALPQVPAGTYTATAVDGTDVSNPETFRLG